ncbi:MAG: UDP-N-acetylmuramoyl-tripeptide--D-alanyl-D-alanine ligase [Chloroflexi bacterium]|nr:UDP-N-acetylmuramoyl-tripeptide--D-alanyl-D-alanine ligase [Chloroflexota bacterium]
MIDPVLIIVLLVWLAGTRHRIYRQARFYQIEEYMSGRYLRWVAASRERWLPARPALAWLIGTALIVVLSEAPGDLLPTLIALASAGVAVWPPTIGEIKKPFRATPRARRLLGAAFVTAALSSLIGLLIVGALPESAGELRFVAVSAVGFILWLLAPLYLVIGNAVMSPVEGYLRGRFVRQARGVLAAVNPTVIGITGSYGKTSTKTYLAHILNGRYHAYPTPKSYNTLMGVCIAINNDLADDYSTEYFVAEMGAYIPGEIARICDLTHPTISIVIEVGPQHLERFGSLENIAIAKYEIIKALPPDGLGVFNWDNPYVRAMYERGYPAERIAVSRMIDPADAPADGPRFVATGVTQSLSGLHFTVIDRQTDTSAVFEAPLLGAHTVTNLLLAAAVAVHEGMSLREVAQRVKGLQPAENRLNRQTTANGITIINDAYSANPVGARNALAVLSMHTTGRRLLITPGMVELGPLMDEENHKLGAAAAAHATDVILVGVEQTAPIKAGLLDAGFPEDRLHVVAALGEAVDWYQRVLQAGDTVLFLNDLPDTYSS